MESFTKHIRTTPTTWHKLKKAADANSVSIGCILEEIISGERSPISMKKKPRRASK